MEYEVIEHDGKPARRYPNGAIRNNRGQVIVPQPDLAKHAITRETAPDMLRARLLKRARLATDGALRAMQDEELILKYGDDAPLVERAQTLQTIASTPDAGKAAVMSAQYLDKLQGYADDPAEAGQVVDAVAGLVRELAQFAATLTNSQYHAQIQAQVQEPDQGGGQGGGREEEESDGVVDGVVDGMVV